MDGRESVRREYNGARRRSVVLVLALLVMGFLIFIWGISTSQYPIGFTEAYRILVDHIMGVPLDGTYEAWMKDMIVFDMNLPRLLGGVGVGLTLSVCGAIMQSVIKNPLADPFTTGISSGALLGVSLSIAFGFSIIPGLTGNSAQMVNAFVFALIPTAAIIIVTILKKNITPNMMILVGIGVMYLFSAFSSLVRYQADPDAAHDIFTWTLGTLGRIDWNNIWMIVGTMVFTLAFGIVASRTLNAMTSGDNLAKTLGINVRLFRTICLTVVAMVTGIVVSYTGTIGFVGLVSPHIARIIVGSDNKLVIPCSALVGAIMLMGSDCIAKVVTTGGLPVGAITALIGSPIFIYLLVKQRQKNW